MRIPEQCRLCVSFSVDEGLCSIHEQLPGEYGREDVKDCPSFIDRNSKDADDLKLLLDYLDEDPTIDLEEKISKAVDNILNDYEVKYKVMIVGIARRKIKSMIKMVDIIDYVLDKMDRDTIADLAPNQAIRLLSELNNSVNNDLSFLMKLISPDTKLQDLQMWIDNRTAVVNIEGKSTDMSAAEVLKLSGASRDKIRGIFDTLLHQMDTEDTTVDLPVDGDTKEV